MAFSDRTRKLVQLACRSEFETIIPRNGMDSECESNDEEDELYGDESTLISFPKATPVSVEDINELDIPGPSSTLIVMQNFDEQLERNQDFSGETDYEEYANDHEVEGKEELEREDTIEAEDQEEPEKQNIEDKDQEELEKEINFEAKVGPTPDVENENPINLSATRPKSPSRKVIKPKKTKPKPIPKFDFHWEPFEYPVTPAEEELSAAPGILPPIEYFKKKFDDDLIALIVDQTNLYSLQMKTQLIDTNKNEIMDFLAIELLMGIVQMPAYTDYWSAKFRYEKIASIMPLKRYQKIRRFLHFVDNTVESNDRYYKIRPIAEHIRKNCLKIEHEKRMSIDEMMVPYKGTRAGLRRQYMKAKPKKWGFKIFVRCGVSGLVYDFYLYGGEDTFRGVTFSDREESFGLSGKVVIALSMPISRPVCSE